MEFTFIDDNGTFKPFEFTFIIEDDGNYIIKLYDDYKSLCDDYRNILFYSENDKGNLIWNSNTVVVNSGDEELIIPRGELLSFYINSEEKRIQSTECGKYLYDSKTIIPNGRFRSFLGLFPKTFLNTGIVVYNTGIKHSLIIDSNKCEVVYTGDKV